MEIELREVFSPRELGSPTLRDRATVSTKTRITKHYVATFEAKEIAFVAIDRPENKSYLCVYELFVEPSQRRHGYGAAIINRCRLIANQNGFKKICLVPHCIEASGSEQKLRAWYVGLGFAQSPDQSDLLEIVF